MFPVEVKYLGDRPLVSAIQLALNETKGDILCFLPGEGEIRRASEHLAAAWGQTPTDCRGHAPADCWGQTPQNRGQAPQNSWGQAPLVLPLYGALAKEEQDKVFKPASRRKVILATSIAETSLTIEGVTAVIDSGLMRVPRYSPVSGMTRLVTLPLTMDRAEQRRGRAGRVMAGVCYRLWEEAENASRPRKMLPEILDADLAQLVLTCAAWGAAEREALPWITPPPNSTWEQASVMLERLGALESVGRTRQITDKGRKMVQLAMHPRLANMMLCSGGGEEAALMAAIIEEGTKDRETDIRYVKKTSRIRQLAQRFAVTGKLKSWGQTPGQGWGQAPGALLAMAFPDRVAKNRGNGTFRMVSGRGAFLPEDDPLAGEPYLVGCELDDRPGDAKIFLACPITEAEIEHLFASEIVEEPYCEWDRAKERVKAVVRRKLGEMTIAEKQVNSGAEIDRARIVEAMVEGIRQKGVENLPCWTKESLQLKARINFLSRHCGWEAITNEKLLAALPGFLEGKNKWRDLEKLDLFQVMDFILSESGHDRRELDRLAPVRMEVPSGSNMLIHYEGDEPTVEVRLQECFGLLETPKVAGGRVPIVMTLLSPAQRPIQITKDLAGFWRGAYQLVRKDMRGRYPKHYWPEDPFTAIATRRVRPKNQ